MKYSDLLCENGILFNNGYEVSLMCRFDNKNCCLIRWCISDKCIKMSSNYKNCINNNNDDNLVDVNFGGISMKKSDKVDKSDKLNINNVLQSTEDDISEILELQNEPELNNKVEYKELVCPVLWVKEKSFAINFKDFGISIRTEHLLDKEKIPQFINVKYESEIGEKDFKIYPIYL